MTNNNLIRKISYVILCVFTLVTVAVTPVNAQNQTIEFIFSDVTDEQASLEGEAKLLVSATGSYNELNTIQVAMEFKGDLMYKSIDYLIGSTNLPDEYQTSTEPSAANASKSVTAAVISLKTPLIIEGETPLFVLTFEGEPKDTATIQLNKSDSWVKDDSKIFAKDKITQKITATETGSQATEAVVVIKMDTIVDFAATSEEPVTVSIKNERTGKVVSGILTEKNKTSLIPVTFTIENSVLVGDTYTVEISANGYKTYKKSGVEFADGYKHIVTNSDFIPGDINKDEIIDISDKLMYEEIISEKGYSAAADFNRDGYVDSKDNVFKNIQQVELPPSKVNKPVVTGGLNSINISWEKPSDNGNAISGYIIKYGFSNTNLDTEKVVLGADSLSETITGLNSGTTYYVSVAAINKVGTGAYSDVAGAATTSQFIPGQGSSSGGGGGGGGGGGASTGSTTPSAGTQGSASTTVPGEIFTDLGNHLWAKDAIYKLKDNGIISGVSATQFAPGNNIKRGDYILILVRMLGLNNEYKDNFADVPKGSYYYEAIARAKAAGIATGDGVNFMPENTITREDLITLAYRAFVTKGYINETSDISVLNTFKDKDSISDYAKTAMASMVSEGIIKGSDGKVNPKGKATRAEVAVMCSRLVGLMENE